MPTALAPVVEIGFAAFTVTLLADALLTPEAPSVAYGVPRVNESNGTMEIDFAVGTDDCEPSDWAEKPVCLTQWERLGK